MKWLEPWFEVTGPDNAPDELKRETCQGHPLHGVAVRVVARRQDCDDVLFELLDGSNRVAVAHLSYQREHDPKWPECHMYTNLADWIDNCMNPDNADWSCDGSEAQPTAAASPAVDRQEADGQ
jgi:hypothetical protein